MGRDYGREALDTLIAQMENHRDDFVVIMAGYPDEMDRLMEGNAGLASRMPYTIEFPAFSREELLKIFAGFADPRIKCESGMLASAREYFLALPDDILESNKAFGNAGFARNLFERTCAKAVTRCQLEGLKDVTLTKQDFMAASAEKGFSAGPKKYDIGFKFSSSGGDL